MTSPVLPRLSAEQRLNPLRWSVLVLTWVVGNTLLLLFRDGFPFPAFNQLDSWFYTGFAWDLTGSIREFKNTYYGARVSWLYPAAMLQAILPPAAANIVLKLLFSGLIALPLASLAHRVAGWRAAWLAVATATFSPQIIAALHGDYIDTPVLAYGMLAVAAIFHARDSRHPLAWIFTAGLAFTLMAVANLGAVANVGVGIALFHLAWHRVSLARQLQMAAVYLAAAIVILGLFQLVHQALGGSDFILEPQWRMVTRLNRLGTNNPWYIDSWEWTVRATWLVVPVGALLWGVWARWSARTDRNADGRSELVASLTEALAFAIGVSFILQLRGSMVLAMSYYASALLSLALPLVLVLGSTTVTESGRRTITLLTALGVALMGWSAVWGNPPTYSEAFKWLRDLSGASGAFVWLALGLVAITAWLIHRLRVRLPMLQAVPPLFLVWALLFLSLPRSYHHVSHSDRLRERYLAIHDAHAYVMGNFEPNGYRFWIDRSFPDAVSLGSTRLWQYRLFDLASFPEMTAPDTLECTVIVPARPGEGESVLAQAREAVLTRRLQPADVHIERIPPRAGIGFDLVCFKLERLQIDPHNPPSFVPTPVMILGLEYDGPNSYAKSLEVVSADPQKPASLALDSHPGFFRPQSPDDYAVTEIKFFPPTTSGERHLVMVIYQGGANPCHLTVRSQTQGDLFSQDLPGPGRHVLNVAAPAESSSYRIRFSSPNGEPASLPSNLLLYWIPYSDAP